MKTAILVDGGFYRKMANHHAGDLSPIERAKELAEYCKNIFIKKIITQKIQTIKKSVQ